MSSTAPAGSISAPLNQLGITNTIPNAVSTPHPDAIQNNISSYVNGSICDAENSGLDSKPPAVLSATITGDLVVGETSRKITLLRYMGNSLLNSRDEIRDARGFLPTAGRVVEAAGKGLLCLLGLIPGILSCRIEHFEDNRNNFQEPSSSSSASLSSSHKVRVIRDQDFSPSELDSDLTLTNGMGGRSSTSGVKKASSSVSSITTSSIEELESSPTPLPNGLVIPVSAPSASAYASSNITNSLDNKVSPKELTKALSDASKSPDLAIELAKQTTTRRDAPNLLSRIANGIAEAFTALKDCFGSSGTVKKAETETSQALTAKKLEENRLAEREKFNKLAREAKDHFHFSSKLNSSVKGIADAFKTLENSKGGQDTQEAFADLMNQIEKEAGLLVNLARNSAAEFNEGLARLEDSLKKQLTQQFADVSTNGRSYLANHLCDKFINAGWETQVACDYVSNLPAHNKGDLVSKLLLDTASSGFVKLVTQKFAEELLEGNLDLNKVVNSLKGNSVINESMVKNGFLACFGNSKIVQQLILNLLRNNETPEEANDKLKKIQKQAIDLNLCSDKEFEGFVQKVQSSKVLKKEVEELVYHNYRQALLEHESFVGADEEFGDYVSRIAREKAPNFNFVTEVEKYNFAHKDEDGSVLSSVLARVQKREEDVKWDMLVYDTVSDIDQKIAEMAQARAKAKADKIEAEAAKAKAEADQAEEAARVEAEKHALKEAESLLAKFEGALRVVLESQQALAQLTLQIKQMGTDGPVLYTFMDLHSRKQENVTAEHIVNYYKEALVIVSSYSLDDPRRVQAMKAVTEALQQWEPLTQIQQMKALIQQQGQHMRQLQEHLRLASNIRKDLQELAEKVNAAKILTTKSAKSLSQKLKPALEQYNELIKLAKAENVVL